MTEMLTPLFDKKEKCLVCEESFTTKKLRSRFIKLDRTDSDFCPYYQDEDMSPLLYFSRVCPSCGFAFTEQFSNYFPPGTRENIKQNITAKWVPHDFSDVRTYNQAIQTYKLALFSGQLKKEKAIVIAGVLIRLAWLYRKLEKHQEENRFLQMALNAYEEAYTEAHYTNSEMTEIRVLYLIGELSRRFGDFKKAVLYFSKVIDQQKTTLETKVINLAREQWYLTREQQKEQKEEQQLESENQEKE